MNLKQRDDLIQAFGDCLPKLKTSALAAQLSKASSPRWSVGVCAAEPWRALALTEGRPWEARLWDLAKGGWRKKPAAGSWPPRPFSAKSFGEAALEKALSEFAALHAPAALLLERRGGRATGRWALPLEAPPAWPHFLRCDLAARFAADAPQLSLLLRDLAVEALVFDGRSLWAFLG